jgi:hypothetical protein
MDGVILTAIVLLVLPHVAVLLTGSGSKGITKPYKTKIGKLHTAKKSREEYLV